MNILLENINTTLAKITECMARDPKRAERLLGDVKRWAGELAKAGTTLRAAGEPLFWYRPCRGGLYEGPHHNNSNLGKMLRDERPGEWVPLYAAPQASAEARELVADGWLDDHITANVKFTRGEMPGVYYCQGWRDAEAHYKLAAPAAENPARGAGDVALPINPHSDYLAKYWRDGFSGKSLGSYTGDAPGHAWHAGKFARETYDRQQSGGGGLHNLVAEKFSSGNTIPVERITITRAEWCAALSATKGESNG